MTDAPKQKEPQRLLFKHIIRKIFLEDWLLKLLALAITFGLWLGVTGLTTNATKRLTVPLIPNVANNAKITNNPITEVDIVISGDERKLKPMTGKDLVAALDLTSVQPGDRVVSLTPENVSVDLPQGVKLDEIQPRRIAVRLEAVEETELPVKPDITGKPADGFEIYGEATVTPQRIRIRGPVNSLKLLQAVSTDPITVDGRKADFTERQVKIKVAAENMTVSDTVVDVTVRIGERRIEKTFTVPLTGVTGSKKATVILYGPKTLIDAIRPDTLKVEMVKPDIGPDTPRLITPGELAESIEVRKIKVGNQ